MITVKNSRCTVLSLNRLIYATNCSTTLLVTCIHVYVHTLAHHMHTMFKGAVQFTIFSSTCVSHWISTCKLFGRCQLRTFFLCFILALFSLLQQSLVNKSIERFHLLSKNFSGGNPRPQKYFTCKTVLHENSRLGVEGLPLHFLVWWHGFPWTYPQNPYQAGLSRCCGGPWVMNLLPNEWMRRFVLCQLSSPLFLWAN